MQKMEAYAREHSFPIIGPAAGHFCYLVARMVGARHVFEMGSGYGYSTAWFAKAVRENGGGVVEHIDWDRGLSERARKHLSKLGFDDIVRYHVADAVQALRQAEGPFDLVFNDIDKKAYPASLPVIAEKLRPGGVLLVDNTLWYGRVLDQRDRESSVQAIRTLNRVLAEDPGWIASLVPVHDGMVVAYRR